MSPPKVSGLPRGTRGRGSPLGAPTVVAPATGAPRDTPVAPNTTPRANTPTPPTPSEDPLIHSPESDLGQATTTLIVEHMFDKEICLIPDLETRLVSEATRIAAS
ncbi:MAG: hypothetical protein ACQSGP_30820, partial [Frankia sp.]